MPSKPNKDIEVKQAIKSVLEIAVKMAHYIALHEAIFPQEINMSEYKPVPLEKSLTVIKCHSIK